MDRDFLKNLVCIGSIHEGVKLDAGPNRKSGSSRLKCLSCVVGLGLIKFRWLLSFGGGMHATESPSGCLCFIYFILNTRVSVASESSLRFVVYCIYLRFYYNFVTLY